VPFRYDVSPSTTIPCEGRIEKGFRMLRTRTPLSGYSFFPTNRKEGTKERTKAREKIASRGKSLRAI